jgi:uncharacterized protein (DUF2235 family)
MSRYAGLLFGAGLRENLGEVYAFLMQNYEPEDRIFVFGFSRGAYNARALTGMLDVFGVFRRGSEHLIPYAVSAYAKQQRRGRDDSDFFKGLRVFKRRTASPEKVTPPCISSAAGTPSNRRARSPDS